MKILRSSTYRRLKAASRNLELLTEQHSKLCNKAVGMQGQLNSAEHEISDLKAELAKYARQRDPQTGRYTSN